MRVPIRKPGKHTHDKLDPHITQDKYDFLLKRLEQLKKKQPALREEVKFLALDGDFSENAAYQIAKGRLRGLNQRILDIENQLKRAVIITSNNNCVIQLGSVVTLETDKNIKTFTILGSTETDPDRNIISHNSPIGKILLGKKVGDVVELNLPSKKVIYKILEIK